MSNYALVFAGARLAAAFLAELTALLVAATLMVLPTAFLAAGLLLAGAAPSVLAAALRVDGLRAGLAGASSTVVWLAVKCRPAAFFGLASTSIGSDAVRFEMRLAAPSLISFSPQISSSR